MEKENILGKRFLRKTAKTKLYYKIEPENKF